MRARPAPITGEDRRSGLGSAMLAETHDEGASVGIVNIAKGLLGGRGGRSGGSVGGVMNLIDQAGGVDGLVSKLRSSGLQDEVGSWVGTGSNQGVSGEGLRNAFGDDELRRAGVDPNDSGGIAEVLPDVIDKLSPGGNVARGDQLKGLLDSFRR